MFTAFAQNVKLCRVLCSQFLVGWVFWNLFTNYLENLWKNYDGNLHHQFSFRECSHNIYRIVRNDGHKICPSATLSTKKLRCVGYGSNTTLIVFGRKLTAWTIVREFVLFAISVTVILSEVQFCLWINRIFSERFGLYFGIAPWCDAYIYVPLVSRHLCGPLNILPYVKHTVLPLAVQYNTAPRSTRYTSHGPSGPDPFWSHRSRQMFVQLLQTEYEQHSVVLEVAHCCTFLILLHFEYKILCL